MGSLKLIIISVVLFSSSIVFANLRIRSYSHFPCSSWNFNGTCNFHSFNRDSAEARSVQRAIDTLDRRIQKLEAQLDILLDENEQLREQINLNQ